MVKLETHDLLRPIYPHAETSFLEIKFWVEPLSSNKRMRTPSTLSLSLIVRTLPFLSTNPAGRTNLLQTRNNRSKKLKTNRELQMEREYLLMVKKTR